MNRRTLTLSLVALTAVVLASFGAPAQGQMAHHHMAEASANVPVDPQTAEMNARVDRLLEILRTTGSLATTVLPKDPNFVTAPQAQTRTFDVRMMTFAFSWDGAPFGNNQTITVNQGDHIIINASVISSDRPNPPGHSLNMENYIPQSFPLKAGDKKTYDFIANQAGDFIFFCGEPTCGTGHGNMFGTFHVNAAAPAPTISALNPSSGPTAGGTLVTISGTGFVSGATVSFGGVSAASTTFNSSTSIVAVTPPQSAGTVDITVRNPDGSSVVFTGFTYVAPAGPTITSVAPASGPSSGGTGVTITGTGFVSGATVTFGGVSATVNSVASSAIVAQTPAHATGDLPSLAVDVVVRNPDGQSATRSSAFTYQAPVSVLGMSGIAPTIGSSAGGTTIRILGSGFTGGVTVTIGGAPAGSVVVVNDTTLTATTASHAVGTVDVVVTKDSSTARLTNGFVYVEPGTVTRRRSAKH